MQEKTKQAVEKYKIAVAKINGVMDATEKFNVSANATQKNRGANARKQLAFWQNQYYPRCQSNR